MWSVIDQLVVEPGTEARLRERSTDATFGLDKEHGKERLADLHDRLDVFQHRLYAESTRSLLLVLQGIDASGKDGIIRSVFKGLNPQGCRAVSFKAPTATERAHDYLSRVHAALPARGELGIFNRSHYEDIVTVRVNGLATEAVWRRRPSHIREWERMLADEGTTMVKVFLNVSKEEQRKRFQERIDDSEKRWKFRLEDLAVRKRFDDYLAAYEEAITETSTKWAPWYVVPADRNWVKALAVAELLVAELERMDPKPPPPIPGIENVVVE
jgi:PPK2 family polyphosphate:nucleotide phosphotransferase